MGDLEPSRVPSATSPPALADLGPSSLGCATDRLKLLYILLDNLNLIESTMPSIIPSISSVRHFAAPADFINFGNADLYGPQGRVGFAVHVRAKYDPAAIAKAAPTVAYMGVNDPGFSKEGTDPANWASCTEGGGGYKGEGSWFTWDPTNAHATWTFAVTPGTYRVSTWWPAGYYRQTHAQYTIRSGGVPAATPVVLNQMNAPQGLVDAGTTWQDLAPAVAITGTDLTVTVTGLTPDTSSNPPLTSNLLYAACVRIEQLAGASLDPGDGVWLSQWGPAAGDRAFLAFQHGTELLFMVNQAGTTHAAWARTNTGPIAGLDANWHSYLLAWTPDGGVAIFQDGTALGTDTPALVGFSGTAPAALLKPDSVLAIGGVPSMAVGPPPGVMFCDIGFWGGLGAADVASLAQTLGQGHPSWTQRPDLLIDALPIFGTSPEVGLVQSQGHAALSGTVSGTTAIGPPTLLTPYNLVFTPPPPGPIPASATATATFSWGLWGPSPTPVTITPAATHGSFVPAAAVLASAPDATVTFTYTPAPLHSAYADDLIFINDGGYPQETAVVTVAAAWTSPPPMRARHFASTSDLVDFGPVDLYGPSGHSGFAVGLRAKYDASAISAAVPDVPVEGLTSPGFSKTDSTSWFSAGDPDSILSWDPLNASATWVFSGVSPGTYRVSAYWGPGGGHTTAAKFSITSGGSQVTSSVIDQIGPSDRSQRNTGPPSFTDSNGVAWVDISPAVAISGTDLTVILTGTLPNTGYNNYIVAGKIRIERLPSASLDSAAGILIAQWGTAAADRSFAVFQLGRELWFLANQAGTNNAIWARTNVGLVSSLDTSYHHFLFAWTTDGGITILKDGVAVATTSQALAGFSGTPPSSLVKPTSHLMIGGVPAVSAGPPPGVTLCDFGFWGGIKSADVAPLASNLAAGYPSWTRRPDVLIDATRITGASPEPGLQMSGGNPILNGTVQGTTVGSAPALLSPYNLVVSPWSETVPVYASPALTIGWGLWGPPSSSATISATSNAGSTLTSSTLAATHGATTTLTMTPAPKTTAYDDVVTITGTGGLDTAPVTVSVTPAIIWTATVMPSGKSVVVQCARPDGDWYQLRPVNFNADGTKAALPTVSINGGAPISLPTCLSALRQPTSIRGIPTSSSRSPSQRMI